MVLSINETYVAGKATLINVIYAMTSQYLRHCRSPTTSRRTNRATTPCVRTAADRVDQYVSATATRVTLSRTPRCLTPSTASASHVPRTTRAARISTGERLEEDGDLLRSTSCVHNSWRWNGSLLLYNTQYHW